jgi:polar amino acid transport system substrate-binding protein
MKEAGRIMALFVALALLSACAHSGRSGTGSAAPVLQRIVEKGELVVGTAGSMPPLNMTTKSGDVKGFEVDLATYMAEGLGVELRLEVMPFPELLDALKAGTIDMVLSGMTMTPERNQEVAFVGPYFVTGKSILTKTQTLLSVKHAEEINSPGSTFVALRGSTSQLFVQVALPRARLVTAEDYDEAVNMVIQGTADAMVADFPICAVSVFRYLHQDQALACLMAPLTYEPIGAAMPAHDPHLINWVENFFNTLEGSGELQELKDNWFRSSWWLKELP